MDVNRIKSEFLEAQSKFHHIELHPTVDGKVYIKTALQAISQLYMVSVKFPGNYPNEMPRVFVDAPVITTAPHRYQNGNICYLHPSMWNPGIHNISFVIARTAKWLNKYDIWKLQGQWPGAEIKH